ncbi:membrane-bound lytic murein transglycosylase D [Catalinimonas alkaloidigena]|uniref:lytic transglycosylase domain-containing protein n=1 Tax=Catalinimonas alkaloidigena TaxID=1075417 RepID=UPI00240761E3|nr:lytic transglycosylase domain-containing protein [Catalinimonas alkaloidigena]MDF9798456.1 membrane-bound lytic murein transglycosylase D [Catalinimonas alkaloidigena]
MEDKSTYYFLSLSLVFIFLYSCSEVNRSISSADISKDSLRRDEPQANAEVEEELTTFDTIISMFAEADSEDNTTPILTASYLDSAANNLFYAQIDTLHQNPYGFEENELVSYPDSVYRKRFANMTSKVNLVFNEQVENFIDLYGIRKKELTERMIGKSMLYFPFIEQALMEKDLPQELKYLTMVESALHADARSNMEAVGLWQIRYRTGKWLGLEINDYLDERRDPYASTRAALNYLDRLHGIYGSWPMALAAYNSGPGNVNKAIVRAGGSHDFWRIREYLPAETRSYVPAFMALVYLNHYPQEHNIRPVFPELPFQAVDTVRVYHEVNFDELAESLEMQEDELEFLNPALIKNIIPSSRAGWPLVLPMHKMATFAKNNQSLTASYPLKDEVRSSAQVLREVVPASDKLKLLEHKVVRGQTMDGISKRYGVSLRQIRDWNAMKDNIIRSGQTLKIYVPASKLASY